MLIRTNIYNRNFYPIKINNLTEKILSEDKINESSKMNINKCTFNNSLGLLLKPFQSIEQITSIVLNDPNSNYTGHIYLDSTIYTDSIDYSTFGIITGQAIDYKHNFVTIHLNGNDNVSNIITAEILNDMPDDFYYELKYSLSDDNDQGMLLNYINKLGFNGFEIDSYSFVQDGIYATAIHHPLIPKQCYNTFYRSDLCTSNSDLIEHIFPADPSSHMKIYQQNNNVFFDLKIKKNLLLNILNSMPENNIIPLYQWPIGISAIITLKIDNLKTPYKINIKIYDNLMFLKTPSGENIDNLPHAVLPMKNFIKNQGSTNYNLLFLNPSTSTILTNPTKVFESHLTIYNMPFVPITNPIYKDKELLFTITNIKQKNDQDEYILNNNLTYTNENLPIKKIINTKNSKPMHTDPIDIIISTIGITEKYTNTLEITYEFDNTTFLMESVIEIDPILDISEPEITYTTKLYSENASKTFLIANSFNTFDYLQFMEFNNDVIDFKLKNIGDANTIIDDIQIENAIIAKENIKNKLNLTDNDIKNLNTLDTCINNHYSGFNLIKSNLKLTDDDVVNFDSKQKVSELFTTKIIQLDYDKNYNAFSSSIIYVKLAINMISQPKNIINSIPTIIKITYRNKVTNTIKETYLYEVRSFNIKYILGEVSIFSSQNSLDYNYIRPNSYNTLYTDFKVNITYPYTQSMFNNIANKNNILLTGIKLINDNNNSKYNISNTEIFLNPDSFPISLTQYEKKQSFDLNTKNDKMYKFKLRFYTNHTKIPFFDIPYTIVSTNLDMEEIIQFDDTDFYVRNNKYFLSLIKLKEKIRTIKILNKSNTPIIINSIRAETISDKFGVKELDITFQNYIELPYTITNINSLILNTKFLGKNFGHFSGFIILHTNLGDIYLHIAAFVNTKYKDVYVLMENRKGTNHIAPLYGASYDYIKLTNFGDDISLLQTHKLGYDKDEFLISNTKMLYPNSTNYIETIFVPTSTGKKISQIDFKIVDMLETFKLLDSNDEYIFKIQNSHILAELNGTSLTDHALPYFTRSVVDFGYISINNIHNSTRIDTFEIKNLGLTPFVITNISKNDTSSPFSIPIENNTLPLKVDKHISLPIIINNNLLTPNQKVYMDVFKFEIQDLKSKKIYNYEIIVKIELTENNREYLSFNSEYINFGYCEINHFKGDEVQIKNFSSDKINVLITYEGNSELQTIDGFSFNLQPNQKFNIPIYFYPHGISNFQGKVIINVNNGNYIKHIDLFGVGVDFKSPLVHIENMIADYYKQLVDYLGNKKYI